MFDDRVTWLDLAEDSILGFTDKKEFVVYDPAQVYPEYIMWPLDGWTWLDEINEIDELIEFLWDDPLLTNKTP